LPNNLNCTENEGTIIENSKFISELKEFTNDRHQGGDGSLCSDDGVLEDGGRTGLDGGDGEADGFVFGVDGVEGLVQAADLAENVVDGANA
jgi:hypothetical protein